MKSKIEIIEQVQNDLAAYSWLAKLEISKDDNGYNIIPIAEYKTLEELQRFLGKLENNFDAPISKVKYFLEPTYYNYSVNLNFTEENNWCCKSTLHIAINGNTQWDNSDTWSKYSYLIEWITSSEHKVIISGCLEDYDNLSGKFIIWIGTEESTTFYPIVKECV